MHTVVELAAWLRGSSSPDCDSAELMAEWYALALELIADGTVVALAQPGGDILYRHVDHCSAAEWDRALSVAQYKALMAH